MLENYKNVLEDMCSWEDDIFCVGIGYLESTVLRDQIGIDIKQLLSIKLVNQLFNPFATDITHQCVVEHLFFVDNTTVPAIQREYFFEICLIITKHSLQNY